MKPLIFTSLLVLSSTALADEVTSSNAINFIGQHVTVCGKAVEVTTVGSDTFINLDKKHHNKDFYFYYYGRDIDKTKLLSKKVCGTGLVLNHKNKSQIIINHPSELNIQ